MRDIDLADILEHFAYVLVLFHSVVTLKFDMLNIINFKMDCLFRRKYDYTKSEQSPA